MEKHLKQHSKTSEPTLLLTKDMPTPQKHTSGETNISVHNKKSVFDISMNDSIATCLSYQRPTRDMVESSGLFITCNKMEFRNQMLIELTH